MYNRMKKKQSRIDPPDSNHPVLQVMALTLDGYNYDTVRKIYEKCQLRASDIIKDSKQWKDAGWTTNNFKTVFWSSEQISISPKAWSGIMRTIQIEQAEKALEISDSLDIKVNSTVVTFVRAFLSFVQGAPFQSQLRQLPWTEIWNKGQGVIAVINEMARQPENTEFLKNVAPEVLGQIYHNVFVRGWIQLDSVKHEEVLRSVFWENECMDEVLRSHFYDSYLYHVEFLKTGQLQEALQQMSPQGKYYRLLHAIELLHEGKPADSFGVFTGILRLQDAEYFAGEPLLNFAYAVSIGLSDTPAARRLGEKLLKSRKVKNDEQSYAMLLALHYYLRSDAAQFYQKNPLDSFSSTMCKLLAVLFLKHYQIFDVEPPVMKTSENWVFSNPLNYLRRLYCDDFEKIRPIAERLKSSTGLTSNLLPTVRIKARWEIILDQLMVMNTPESESQTQNPGEKERVAYFVNLQNNGVQPKLQKSKDGGITWSKGRNIALKTFRKGGEKYMTSQDREVASFVSTYEYGWYGNEAYELCGPKVIAALAGCPNVYSEKTEEHIDIVEESLQLTVRPGKDGYKVRSNVEPETIEGGICIREDGSKQVTVIRVSPAQRKTLELLQSVETFPMESQAQLTGLLQNLSAEFTIMSPLLKDAADLKRVEANALIAVQISPEEDGLYNVTLAVKPFGTCPPYQRPGKGMEIVSTTIEGERVQTERDLKLERKHLEKLRMLFRGFEEEICGEDEWEMDTAKCLEMLERLRTAQDFCYVEWPQGVKMRVARPVITPEMLTLKISSAGQWFELEGDLQIGDREKIQMARLLELLRSSTGNFIRLSDDEYVALSEQLRHQLQSVDKMLSGRGKDLKVAAMNGMQLAALEEMGAKVKADDSFRQMMQRIREAAQMQFPVPSNIHAELRNYQLAGYEWMSRLAHWGGGACLADDMGLGKTLQAITLMQSRAALGPQLVVMPTSLLHNWKAELQRFAPALGVRMLNQQGADRGKLVNEAGPGDIVLATYGLLVTEAELISGHSWTSVVLDEAHTIKNRDTQTSKSAMTLKADFRLLLTGTPLQNHLSEIWNLFQFANPGLLGSFQQFTDRFIMPIERDHDQERQRLLRRMLSPFMLRRTKDDVLGELPDKTEVTVRVELSAAEQALYDNLRQQAISNLEEHSGGILQTLAEITRLRQAACHPKLINPKLAIPSSKTRVFLDLVEDLRQNGHRALVFSQFTSHLALIREALDRRYDPTGKTPSPDYLYLDGSTSTSERNRLVLRFQTGEQPLFLISLKAGGLGLNLTAADYVIHLDPWWNPAIEDQASDRAHRIGQERPVTVYRLISVGTIEEKIIRLHLKKRSLADALLQEADLFSQISAEDVIRLLRESAEEI